MSMSKIDVILILKYKTSILEDVEKNKINLEQFLFS